VSEQRTREPPERVAPESDRDDGQQHLSERLMGDGLERALLVRGRAAGAESELDREDADDSVDQPASGEARAREPFEAAAVRDLLAAGLGLADGTVRIDWRLGARGGLLCTGSEQERRLIAYGYERRARGLIPKWRAGRGRH